MYYHTEGDWKFEQETFDLAAYANDNCCHRCNARKTAGPLCYTWFDEDFFLCIKTGRLRVGAPQGIPLRNPHEKPPWGDPPYGGGGSHVGFSPWRISRMEWWGAVGGFPHGMIPPLWESPH